MSYCIINSKNFSSNVKEIEKYIEIDKIAIVLKNNAYGHGLKEMASLAKKNGIKHAVVINYSEAILINEYFETILVLSGIPDSNLLPNVHLSINDMNDLDKIPLNAKVEIKIDTGMHRNGIDINQIEDALKIIKTKKIKLAGIFTHFSNAFEDDGSLDIQKNVFDKIKKNIKKNYSNIRFHCSSSPSLFRIDNSDYDIVRVGIALYGYVDLPKSIKKPNLKPVLSLWANKVSNRKVLKGDSIGYGNRFYADKDFFVSTYDVGYGNGFFRSPDDKKIKISDGRLILGRISMNNLSVEGHDENICIFSDVSKLAEIHNTICYEILCRLSSNITKRIQ